MKIIFMGTPDFAAGSLQKLLESEHQVVAVVTQPDKPKGRGGTMQSPPVKEAAKQAGVMVCQPVRVRNPEFLKVLQDLEADVVVVVAFGQILPPEILSMKRYGCINVHASLLPKYRGAAPIQWAVINGETESGVTTMQMDAGLDTGDMLLKAVVPLSAKETAGSLFVKLKEAGAELLLKTLDGLASGTITPQKQGETPTAYAKMLKKEMGLIDWTKDAVVIERLIRGLNPWPSAYTKLDGKTLKIWAADVIPKESGKAPGSIIEAAKDRILVQTGNGLLAIKNLQLEGKKRMDADAFLRGFPLKEGIRLCC